jgi:hypothetical protein
VDVAGVVGVVGVVVAADVAKGDTA